MVAGSPYAGRGTLGRMSLFWPEVVFQAISSDLPVFRQCTVINADSLSVMQLLVLRIRQILAPISYLSLEYDSNIVL